MTADRSKMARSARGTLLFEWTTDDREMYRIVSIGRYFVIEKLEADAIGEPRWAREDAFDKSDSRSMLLLGAIKEAQRAPKALRQDVPTWNHGTPPDGVQCLIVTSEQTLRMASFCAERNHWIGDGQIVEHVVAWMLPPSPAGAMW